MNKSNKKLIHRSISLKKQVIAFYLICIILPVLIFSQLTFRKSSDLLNRKVTQYCQDIMQEIGVEIDANFSTIDQLMVTIATNDTIQKNIRILERKEVGNLQRTNLSNQIEKALINSTAVQDSIQSVAILTDKGNIYSSNYELPIGNITEEEKNLINAGNGSGVWMNHFAQEEEIVCARVLYDLESLKRLGYLVVMYDRHFLEKSLLDKKYFSEGSICIVNSENEIICSNGKNQETLRREKKELKNNIAIEKENIVVEQVIEEAKWMIRAVIPSAVFENEIITLRNWISMIAPLCIVFGFLLACYIANRIFQPLQKMMTTMRQVKQGNMEARWDYSANNELGIISHRFNEMMDEIDGLMKKTTEQQALNHEMEMQALIMQINPHFIYNTLDAIGWMALSEKRENVFEAINALGKFMRQAINGPEMIELSMEKDNLLAYMEIQKIRHGDRLEYEIDIPREISDAIVPKLILQPLVENSIVHGLEEKIGTCHINISAKMYEEQLHIWIEDDGVGIPPEIKEKLFAEEQENTSRHSIGVKNVHKRIQVKYGKEYGLQVSSEVGVGTMIELRMPYLTHRAQRDNKY